MKYKLSIKNVFQNPARTFTLAFFIFVATIIIVMCNTLFQNINQNMENSLINTFTAHVLIRKDIGENKDLFTMDAKWNKEDKLSQGEISEVIAGINESVDTKQVGKRIRANVTFNANLKKVPSMIVGLEEGLNAYEDSVQLTEGRYLDLTKDDEVILMDEQAEKLNLSLGDRVQVMAMAGEEIVIKDLEIVGIGSIDLLSAFNFPAAFMNYQTAYQLAGMQEGEASDIAVYLDSKTDAGEVSKEIGELALSPNLKILSDPWEDLGGYISNSIGIYTSAINGFIVVMLIIVAIMIINLVLMMGLERRQEIGTLRAIGFSISQNVKIFMAEIVAVGFVAASAGAAVASIIIFILSGIKIVAPSPMNYLLGKEFYMQFDLAQVIIAVSIMSVVVIIASFYPCFKNSSLKPAETLQEV